MTKLTKNEHEIIVLENKHSKLELSLFGATVLSFVPNGHKDIMWLGTHNQFNKQKAIRGGVPICWPKFGDENINSAFPKHGFARMQDWTLENISETDDESLITLNLKQNSHFASILPINASATLKIVVGKTLKMQLETTNNGDTDFSYSEGLHTYFLIGDINQITINGLDGSSYVDRLDSDTVKKVKGDFGFSKMEDTVFADSKATTKIIDKTFKRVITITKEGSESTIVWNPYKKEVSDEVVGDEYKDFVCVEAGNVLNNFITLKAGQSHTLAMEISVDNL